MKQLLTILALVISGAVGLKAQVASDQEYVDMGLPSGNKWATRNLGAKTPYEYGDYFQYGELKPFTGSDFAYEKCRLNDKQVKDISGNPTYDAAMAKLGGSWRMPTKTDFEELLDFCEWTYDSENGHAGYVITSPNGKSIFLPSAGIVFEMGLEMSGTAGTYWTSTPYGKDNHLAYAIGFADPWDPDTDEESDEDTRDIVGTERHFGASIRPVLKK